MYSLIVLMFFFISLLGVLLFIFFNRNKIDEMILFIVLNCTLVLLIYTSMEIYERAKALDNIPIKQELEPGGPR